MPLVANDGRIYINLRFETRVLELAKGKSAIEVGDKKQLVPVIEALRQAVTAGEIDAQLTTTGAEVSSRFGKLLKRSEYRV